jgi:hypothetical protein
MVYTSRMMRICNMNNCGEKSRKSYTLCTMEGKDVYNNMEE